MRASLRSLFLTSNSQPPKFIPPKDSPPSIDNTALYTLQLSELAKSCKSRRIVLLPHSDPDLDALCSAAHFLSRLGTDSSLCISGTPYKAANRVIERFEVPTIHADRINFSEFNGAIVMDTSERSRIPKIPPELPIIAVVDHRFRFKEMLGFAEPLRGSIVDIADENFTSTCELLALCTPVDNLRSAHLLSLGMLSDTDIFKRKADNRTLRLIYEMQEKFNLDFSDLKVQIFERPTAEEEERMFRSIQRAALVRIGDFTLRFIRYSVLDRSHLSFISKNLLPFGSLIVAMARGEGSTAISIKSKEGCPVDCRYVMGMLIHTYGGDGGAHKIGAGGRIKATPFEIKSSIIGFVECQLGVASGFIGMGGFFNFLDSIVLRRKFAGASQWMQKNLRIN